MKQPKLLQKLHSKTAKKLRLHAPPPLPGVHFQPFNRAQKSALDIVLDMISTVLIAVIGIGSSAGIDMVDRNTEQAQWSFLNYDDDE